MPGKPIAMQELMAARRILDSSRTDAPLLPRIFENLPTLTQLARVIRPFQPLLDVVEDALGSKLYKRLPHAFVTVLRPLIFEGWRSSIGVGAI